MEEKKFTRSGSMYDYEIPEAVPDEFFSLRKTLGRFFNFLIFGKGSGLGNPDSSHAGSFYSDQSTSVMRRLKAHSVRALEFRPKVAYTISPQNRFFLIWEQWILMMAVFSVILTPIEFGFYRGLPDTLFFIELTNNMFFVIDIFLTFFVAYKDPRTFNMIENHRDIASRYISTTFFFDCLACIPWDYFYRVSTQRSGAEVMRALMWVRLIRTYRVSRFFDKIERHVKFSYYGTRILRLLCVEYFFIHISGCIFYYLATTVDGSNQGGTWIGSLTLGNFPYTDFWTLDLGLRYVTAIYWATVTLSTTGYGDIHPVNAREMICVIIILSINLFVAAYIVGNVTALVVKGSETEKFRDKMSEVIQYIRRKEIPKDVRHEMKEHVQLRFEAEQMDDEVIEDFPAVLRMKVSLSLYKTTVEDCFLFKNCTTAFIDEVIARSHSEIFMPMEIVVQQKGAGDFMYVVRSGTLEQVIIEKDGSERLIATLNKSSTIGDISLLCDIPQPFTVIVKELAEVLRIDKQSFNLLLSNFIADGRTVVENLLEKSNEPESPIASLTAEIRKIIELKEAELITNTITAASRGDLELLKQFIHIGAKANSCDYDGRTALHLAASRGFYEIVKFLIHEGADVNFADNFGVTPLQEALKKGHEDVAGILVENGGKVNLQEAGSELCNAVIHGNTALLQRLINNGVDPNSADYDLRTPLHIACAEGFLLIARMLVTNGADVAARDRWGNTPLDEAQRSGSQPVVDLLEEAMLQKLGGKVTEEAAPAPSKEKATPPNEKLPAVTEKETDTTLTLAAATVARTLSIVKEEADQEIMETRSQPRSEIGTPSRSSVGSPSYGRRRSRSTGLTGHLAKKRVTIYPYHPWTQSRKPGVLIFFPASIEELLQTAEKQFGEKFTRIFNLDGGQIKSIDLMLDGDRLYLANDEEIEAA